MQPVDFTYISDKEGFVSKDVYCKRIDLCSMCEKVSKDLIVKNDLICSLCHCDMNSKALVEYSKCPLGKW
jgi:hypothetical protein